MSRWMIVLGGVVALLAIMVGTVSADSAVQINNAENGFLGGDVLHYAPNGCVLRKKDGVEIGRWDNTPIDMGPISMPGGIDYALDDCAKNARNSRVGFSGNIYYESWGAVGLAATQGIVTMWAVYNGPNANPTCSLQLNGYTEPGKPVQFTFTTNTDGSFNPLPVPVKEEPAIQPGFGGIS